jgi:hypothetical protein
MNPYIRASKKFPAMRARALERLGKRPERPDRPAKPGGRVRAREAAGTFKGDNPATPVVDEAWVDGVTEP